MIIELGSPQKRTLRLACPVMVAAGCYGLGTEYRGLVDEGSLGAVVVGPVTPHPRRGAHPPRAVPIPGGILLHTGLDNPGLPAVLQRYSRAWARSPAPVILHLAATTPDEVEAACERLAAVETVAAVELGLADFVEPDEAATLVAAAVTAYERGPVLVRLPLEAATRLAGPVAAAGADALVVGAPPRGTTLHQGRFITGRLYGPFVLPLAMRALRRVAEVVDRPLIGCGGVYTASDAVAFLRAGAVAVQVGSLIWRNPAEVARIAREAAGWTVKDGRGSD